MVLPLFNVFYDGDQLLDGIVFGILVHMARQRLSFVVNVQDNFNLVELRCAAMLFSELTIVLLLFL